MLDARITIINGTMTSFDRKNKTINIKDHQSKVISLNFDNLVICVGLVDNTIKEFKREKAALKEREKERDKDKERDRDIDYSTVKNIYSIDDPYIYRIFEKKSPDAINPNDPLEMMTHKKRPQKIILYGRSVNNLSFASGLIRRGVDPRMIILVFPAMSYKQKDVFDSNAERIDYEDNKLNDMDAFDGDVEVKNKVFEAFREMGIKIYEDLYLQDILVDAENKFEGLVLKPEKGDKGETVFAKILVTASVIDIEEELFKSIQENGLVYNGRLIVKNSFKTEDLNIFACGKIVEFSQMYKNYALGKSLRLDRFSGRELGQKLGQSVLESLGIMAPIAENDPRYEKLPSFEMPTGVCAYLPGDLMYIRVTSLPEGMPKITVDSDNFSPK